MLKKHLHLRPCEATSINELKVEENFKRAEYCRWLRDVITAKGEYILDITFITYEAYFHVSGYVNSQINRVWSATNPHEIKDIPLHDRKVGVWYAMSRSRIIDPLDI
jgi:hypothetical protein